MDNSFYLTFSYLNVYKIILSDTIFSKEWHFALIKICVFINAGQNFKGPGIKICRKSATSWGEWLFMIAYLRMGHSF